MRQLLVTKMETQLSRGAKAGGARTILLAAVCLAAGLGLGVLWRYRTTERPAGNVSGQATGQDAMTLSSGTKAVLQRLTAPVEIRFYSLLDPAATPDAVTVLSARVEQLLAAYEREAGNKIKVTRHTVRSDANAAAADGITAFNRDKGDACYLGLAVVQAGRKESLPQLVPEWEHALESDLSRAIGRVASTAASGAGAAVVLPVDPVATAEVKRQIPDLANVSLEEGSRVLRAAALQDFKAAVSEMEAQLKQAEARVAEAQNGKSEAEQQAAVKNLQRVQAEQAVKLRDITIRSSAQIEALRQLKTAGR